MNGIKKIFRWAKNPHTYGTGRCYDRLELFNSDLVTIHIGIVASSFLFGFTHDIDDNIKELTVWVGPFMIDFSWGSYIWEGPEE